VQAVDPATNLPFHVQIPPGLQPGQTFSCALPAQNSPSLVTALANAGGKLVIGLVEPGPGASFLQETHNSMAVAHISVTNGSGALVCTIRFGAMPENGVLLTMPDGSEGAVLSNAKVRQEPYPGLKGDVGPGGKKFFVSTPGYGGCCHGYSDTLMEEGWSAENGAESVISLGAPCRPWVIPFLLVTACMGVCCVGCMSCEPTWLVKRGDTTCGEVHRGGACASASFQGGCCQSPVSLFAEDPAALHGALLCIIMNHYHGCFFIITDQNRGQ